MSILLERVQSKQVTPEADQGAPVLAPGAGVVQWGVIDGASVTGGCQNVGEITSSYGAAIIGCEHVGTLHYLVQDNARVKAGQPIAYVKPVEARQRPASGPATNHTGMAAKAAQRGAGEGRGATANGSQIETGKPNLAYPSGQQGTEVARTPTNGHGTAAAAGLHQNFTRTSPESAPEEAHLCQTYTGSGPENAPGEAPTRRSTLPTIEELVEVEELRLAPAPASAAVATNGNGTGQGKKKRETTPHHTYHVATGQVRRVKKLAGRLDLEDVVPGCNESELIRAAIEMLLELPAPALLAVIRENRAREKAGGYGVGYRRGPGK